MADASSNSWQGNRAVLKGASAEHVEEWGALARHVHLAEALPSAQLTGARAKVRF